MCTKVVSLLNVWKSKNPVCIDFWYCTTVGDRWILEPGLKGCKRIFLILGGNLSMFPLPPYIETAVREFVHCICMCSNVLYPSVIVSVGGFDAVWGSVRR